MKPTSTTPVTVAENKQIHAKARQLAKKEGLTFEHLDLLNKLRLLKAAKEWFFDPDRIRRKVQRSAGGGLMVLPSVDVPLDDLTTPAPKKTRKKI